MICDIARHSRGGAKPPNMSLAAQIKHAGQKVITEFTFLGSMGAEGFFFVSIVRVYKKQCFRSTADVKIHFKFLEKNRNEAWSL